MKTRKELNDQIEANTRLIKELQVKNLELRKEELMLSDEDQQYIEEEEKVTIRHNGKKVKKTYIVGRIHWKEDFKDEDTGEVVTIERSSVVKVNGEWQ